MLNKSGNNGYLSLVPDIRGNAFSFSSLSTILAVGLSYMAFIILRYSPFISTLPIINGMLNFVRCFFYSYWVDYMIFILFVNMVYHFEWFADVEASLHPWNKFHLVTVYDLLNVLLHLIYLIFCWGFLHLMFIRHIGLCVCVCVCSVASVMTTSLWPYGL